MKKVLIIDKHPLFREFLKTKLEDAQSEVILTQENRDSYAKTISNLPNLIILDMDEENDGEMEYLEKKAEDLNTVSIPVIITGPSTERANIASFAKYGVIKYFIKPIQFDVFFEAVGQVLRAPVMLDSTPCVLDIHRNGSIIFVEIALGLNREKLALLQFKLTELIENSEMDSPKIILMLSSLELSFVDGYNLEFLIDNILACPKVHTKNVKVLSLSPFMQDFLEGHNAYSGIEMSNNLTGILNSLMDTSVSASIPDLITDRILSSSGTNVRSTVETRFLSDSGSAEATIAKLEETTVLRVAIIDSDMKTLSFMMTTFESIRATAFLYNSGEAFQKDYEPGKFDLVILDVMISDNSGFQILSTLNNQYDAPPVVVYSESKQRDLIVKVLSSGAKSYLVKPQKPNMLITKCLGVLKGE